ncbi:MAG: phosphatidylserine decarboxylase [Gammaproteobacteria bacterium]|nr:phosphatidylserine decarboxylase [Gammaproteobacteria bacterium]
MNKAKPDSEAGWRDIFLSALLYPLPQHWISRLVFRLTRLRTPIKNPAIRWFIRHFQIDMSEALLDEADHYPDFNAFFTRELKNDARPIDANSEALVSPVDGTVSQIGVIDQGTLIQAKGRHYSVLDLLGGQRSLAETFINGRFATIYLSPRDYHRIHMPLQGKLEKMIYVPGRLFSVAPHTTRAIPNLFARNERVVSYFENSSGPFVMVLVGAINVAAIETSWHGLIKSNHQNIIAEYDYSDRNIELLKGQEMGRFNLGSTVILLTTDKVSWLPQIDKEKKIQYGQRIGTVN